MSKWRSLANKLSWANHFSLPFLATPKAKANSFVNNNFDFTMDVDASHFRKQLLPILKHIANASYVSFDLEMSGISTRIKPTVNRPLDQPGKPSLQSMYEEMKGAAEKFQVLQFGITCVEEDREREYYLARPFNFNVSPLTADGVDLRQDRIFTFSSSACDFLLKNNFDFGKVFTEGVTYLSREEEEALEEEFKQRAEKNSKIPDIVIAQDDSSTLEFYRSARRKISNWVQNKQRGPEEDYVNIGSEAGSLNGFQRRLIHQLVRNEFPTLRTFARCDGSFMQIEALDVKREIEFQARKKKQFGGLLAKQKGLAWIFEALAGGDLSTIPPEWFYNRMGENAEEDLQAVNAQLKDIMETLKEKTQVIVGHNLFTDLGFLYNTFIGPLPSNVKHFQEDIHELFPIVIDTKFLATYGADAMGPRSNLKELLDPFTKVHVPLIVLHEQHTKYGAAFGLEHEAGYDSWMTAELFAKLSSQLYADWKNLGCDQGYDYLSDDDEEPKQLKSPDLKSKIEVGVEDAMSFSDDEDQTSSDSSASSAGGVTLGTLAPKSNTNVPSGLPAWHAKQLNPYSVLADQVDDKDSVASIEYKPRQWVPSMENPFWNIYANKLKVNACEKGFCDLEETSDD